MVVTEERVFVVDPYAGLCPPPLACIPITESEVSLLVAEYIQGHIVLVADCAVVTFVAILMRLVGIFSVNRRIGVACADEQVKAIKQEVKLL